MKCPVCDSESWRDKKSIKDHSISKESFEVGVCENCGMTATVNAPPPSDIGRYYNSDVYISHSDTSEGVMDKLYHSVRKRMLVKKHGIVVAESDKKSGQLLDIGSGTGYFPHHMSTNGWNVEGIEVDEGARKSSIEKFGLVVHEQSKIYDLDTDHYDAITMWHVLEHVSDLNGYFAAIHKALRSDGIFVIAVPNCGSQDAKHYGSDWAAWDVPRHLWHFRPAQIEQLGKKHGFQVDKMIGMPMDSYYVSMLSEKYRGKGLSLLRGTYRGWLSNLNAVKDVTQSSSIIYILKKES